MSENTSNIKKAVNDVYQSLISIEKHLTSKKSDAEIEAFREHIEKTYSRHPTGCGGGFDELLCYELHTQPVNPRMSHKTFNNGYCTGLTFKELALKWGISTSFLGKLIADHCEKLEDR